MTFFKKKNPVPTSRKDIPTTRATVDPKTGYLIETRSPAKPSNQEVDDYLKANLRPKRSKKIRKAIKKTDKQARDAARKRFEQSPPTRRDINPTEGSA
tara:strand:+ start:39 stop:332 length:294 start_codon:yes stop_codon:yes gene_type:complete